MRRVISLYLPSWPTSRIRKSNCVPPEHPLLTASLVGGRSLVMAVDARAHALGLRPGMALTHAQAMVPNLHIEEADPAGDAAALKRLAAWCLRHISPLAAANPPDGLWIDITGGAHLFGGEQALLTQLTSRLQAAGFAASAACAATPGAAHALARHGAPLSQIAPENTAQALAPLPVGSLRLPPETVQALRTLGFDTIGQLMATPRAPLTKRFGTIVFQRLDQALGHAPEPIEPLALPDLPRARMGFPEPIATPDDLARATTLLAERLCEKLRHAALGASRLDLVFQRVDGAAQIIRIGTSAPTRDAAHLLRLLHPRLEQIDPGFGIEAASLAAPLTNRLGAVQNLADLCATTPMPDLAALIDILLNQLGPNSIFRLQPVESDVPERALRAVPPLSPASRETWPESLPRPPRLFTPPRPIQAMALLPDHAPISFIWRRQPHRVRHADGPERIFAEWWKTTDDPWAVRDYFTVEDEHGQRFWLFRRGDGEHPETGNLSWFLHGIF